MPVASNEQRAMSKEERQKASIRNFTDINAWQEAHRLYVAIHLATKTFPKDELFGLVSQIRRASLSVTSNIAEGFGRSSDPDKVHFYIMARGSLFEVQNQLIAAKDISYLKEDLFNKLIDQALMAQRILIGLINSTKLRGKI